MVHAGHVIPSPVIVSQIVPRAKNKKKLPRVAKMSDYGILNSPDHSISLKGNLGCPKTGVPCPRGNINIASTHWQVGQHNARIIVPNPLTGRSEVWIGNCRRARSTGYSVLCFRHGRATEKRRIDRADKTYHGPIQYQYQHWSETFHSVLHSLIWATGRGF